MASSAVALGTLPAALEFKIEGEVRSEVYGQTTSDPNAATANALPILTGSVVKGHIEPYLLNERFQDCLYGVMYRGIGLHTGDIVAAKLLIKEKIKEKECDRDLPETPLAEVFFAPHLHGHPNIFTIREVCEVADFHFVVSDLAQAEDLLELLKIHSYGLPQKYVRYFMRQAAAALAFAHRHRIAMQDFSLENCLVFIDHSGDYKIRVCDPGQAVRFPSCPLTGKELPVAYSGCVGKKFRPPEIFMKVPYYATKVDSWCLGWATFYLLFAVEIIESVWEGDHDIRWEYFQRNRFEELFQELQITDRLAPVARDFILRLMHPDANLRMSVAEALDHKFLSPEGVPTSLQPSHLKAPAMANSLSPVQSGEIFKKFQLPNEFIPSNNEQKRQWESTARKRLSLSPIIPDVYFKHYASLYCLPDKPSGTLLPFEFSFAHEPQHSVLDKKAKKPLYEVTDANNKIHNDKKIQCLSVKKLLATNCVTTATATTTAMAATTETTATSSLNTKATRDGAVTDRSTMSTNISSAAQIGQHVDSKNGNIINTSDEKLCSFTSKVTALPSAKFLEKSLTNNELDKTEIANARTPVINGCEQSANDNKSVNVHNKKEFSSNSQIASESSARSKPDDSSFRLTAKAQDVGTKNSLATIAPNSSLAKSALTTLVPTPSVPPSILKKHVRSQEAFSAITNRHALAQYQCLDNKSRKTNMIEKPCYTDFEAVPYYKRAPSGERIHKRGFCLQKYLEWPKPDVSTCPELCVSYFTPLQQQLPAVQQILEQPCSIPPLPVCNMQSSLKEKHYKRLQLPYLNQTHTHTMEPVGNKIAGTNYYSSSSHIPSEKQSLYSTASNSNLYLTSPKPQSSCPKSSATLMPPILFQSTAPPSCILSSTAPSSPRKLQKTGRPELVAGINSSAIPSTLISPRRSVCPTTVSIGTNNENSSASIKRDNDLNSGMLGANSNMNLVSSSSSIGHLPLQTIHTHHKHQVLFQPRQLLPSPSELQASENRLIPSTSTVPAIIHSYTPHPESFINQPKPITFSACILQRRPLMPLKNQQTYEQQQHTAEKTLRCSASSTINPTLHDMCESTSTITAAQPLKTATIHVRFDNATRQQCQPIPSVLQCHSIQISSSSLNKEDQQCDSKHSTTVCSTVPPSSSLTEQTAYKVPLTPNPADCFESFSKSAIKDAKTSSPINGFLPFQVTRSSANHVNTPSDNVALTASKNDFATVVTHCTTNLEQQTCGSLNALNKNKSNVKSAAASPKPKKKLSKSRSHPKKPQKPPLLLENHDNETHALQNTNKLKILENTRKQRMSSEDRHPYQSHHQRKLSPSSKKSHRIKKHSHVYEKVMPTVDGAPAIVLNRQKLQAQRQIHYTKPPNSSQNLKPYQCTINATPPPCWIPANNTILSSMKSKTDSLVTNANSNADTTSHTQLSNSYLCSLKPESSHNLDTNLSTTSVLNINPHFIESTAAERTLCNEPSQSFQNRTVSIERQRAPELCVSTKTPPCRRIEEPEPVTTTTITNTSTTATSPLQDYIHISEPSHLVVKYEQMHFEQGNNNAPVIPSSKRSRDNTDSGQSSFYNVPPKSFPSSSLKTTAASLKNSNLYPVPGTNSHKPIKSSSSSSRCPSLEAPCRAIMATNGPAAVIPSFGGGKMYAIPPMPLGTTVSAPRTTPNAQRLLLGPLTCVSGTSSQAHYEASKSEGYAATTLSTPLPNFSRHIGTALPVHALAAALNYGNNNTNMTNDQGFSVSTNHIAVHKPFISNNF